ncbi:MAG: S-layer protein [Cyanobacteria bacterium P01_D01_bin.105]
MTQLSSTTQFSLRQCVSFVRALPARTCSIGVVLLWLTACSGSQLGDTVGKSLEPDPQLADNPDVVAEAPPLADPDSAETPEASETGESEAESKTEDDVEKTEESAATNPEEKKTEEKKPADGQVVVGEYTDLGKAPEEIQSYLVDLLTLELLEVRPPATPSPSGSAAEDNENQPKADIPGPNEFRPNRAITRREYARWLLAVNNEYYKGQRNRKIRAGVASSAPVFQDVRVQDPDFAAIQGLAEAGIIPSPLTGSSTTVTFRPDAPLTRKDLLLWKVPLDTRQPLPQATPDAVREAWGFQDAGKIEPRALQAVLADYQNGDFANIRRAFGYTTLLQPDKAATRAEAAAVLWRIGNSTEAITAEELLNPRSANNTEES